jgi:hypothetical protein
MTGIRLDAGDAAELAGLLPVPGPGGWPAIPDHDQSAARAKSPEGGGFAAAHFRARRAGYGAAPPAPRVLRIALRATALRAALGPGDHCGPWDQEERAGSGLPPRCARRANPRDGSPQEQAERQDTDELAFDSHTKQENYKPREMSRIKRSRSVKDQVRLDTDLAPDLAPVFGTVSPVPSVRQWAMMTSPAWRVVASMIFRGSGLSTDRT